MKCSERMYYGGYRDLPCKNRAKWMVNGKPYCGVHARIDSQWVQYHGRVPIEKGATK